MRRFIVNIVVWFLRNTPVSLKERHVLINAVLDKLAALPLRDIIQVNGDGSLAVNGTLVSREEATLLRESAKGALHSRALGLVRDQVLFKAFTFGVNSSVNFDQLYFAKAAIWWGQEEQKILEMLSTYGEDTPDTEEPVL